MILAAGLGKRMGNLTQDTPKALLTVNHKPLIVYRIEQLMSAGVKDIVINVHQHREAFEQALGDGSRFNCCIQYSFEDEVLETAGGIIQALPLLGDQPFIITSCDTLTDFNFSTLMIHDLGEHLAHLVLVDNPPHHPEGDYGLINGQVSLEAKPKYNYAGFGLLHPQLFAGLVPGKRKKAEVFADAIPKKLITGEHYEGQWMNIDTPQRLAQAQGSTH
ncbi:MAG: mannose-1-phosphate guanylyltransferase [Gammaproteobacteria bacterium CG11_big_fil_rev_8_21_14_0_20_46_22]|nr:MAG: mannose-1-phosphate guanylyltransferase [Gammaproteobacteria bacterium CG12_big_fil_rev_8_21_14_0_65_46_12]PIR10712.1 MAG: mannose-1-phosphate guanylyltransferase [Gammaproteobacteria bacterium CG11_big_fil_rev_8_21_14_0_20_46_22]